MNAWWSELTAPEQVLWVIAVFTTVVFFLQLMISLVTGHDHADSDLSTDGDVHGDADGVSWTDYFTIKNLIAFFLGFSWGAISMLGDHKSLLAAIVVGGFIGVAMVAVNLLILRALASLKGSGNANLRTALGSEGVVSVLVPANNAGYGKVTVNFGGRQMELMALTAHGNDLVRGCPVKVTSVTESRVSVQPISQH